MNTHSQTKGGGTTAQHTPTPWIVVHEDEDSCFIDTVAPRDPQWAVAVPQGSHAEANARFIVIACNSYESSQRRIAELEGAIRPFAGLDINAMESLGKKPDHPVFGLNKTLFTLGDVQRARAAIQPKP